MWRRIRNAAARVGRAASSLFVQAVNVVKETVNRALGVVDFLAGLAGIMPRKKLRLQVAILRDEQGSPVATHQEVMLSINLATHIFRNQANVEIVPAGGEIVTTLPDPAPAEALEVRCNVGAWLDDLRRAGDYFGRRQARNARGTLTGYGAPITAFIVRNVEGKRGCSLGPLVDYVTVDLRGLEDSPDAPGPVPPIEDEDEDEPPIVIQDVVVPTPRTLAHEIGHACGLWHSSDPHNLMHSRASGSNLRRRQAAIVRNSRFVTYL